MGVGLDATQTLQLNAIFLLGEKPSFSRPQLLPAQPGLPGQPFCLATVWVVLRLGGGRVKGGTSGRVPCEGTGCVGGRRWSPSVLLECGEVLGAVRGVAPSSSSPLLGLLFGILELIFPQKQSSSVVWLPARPKGTRVSSERHSPRRPFTLPTTVCAWGRRWRQLRGLQLLGQPSQGHCGRGSWARPGQPFPGLPRRRKNARVRMHVHVRVFRHV